MGMGDSVAHKPPRGSPCPSTHTHMLVLGEVKQRRGWSGRLPGGRDNGTPGPTPRGVCSRGHFRGWVAGGGEAQDLYSPSPSGPLAFPLLTSLTAAAPGDQTVHLP